MARAPPLASLIAPFVVVALIAIIALTFLARGRGAGAQPRDFCSLFL